MRIGKNSVLGDLPPLKGEQELLVECQDVNDIVKAVLESHRIFSKDYDQIWSQFYNPDPNKIYRSLFDFCKQNIGYLEEGDDLQTVKSPTAILAFGEGDCKHYASFIGGVLDAMNRNTDANIKWTYRFASYNILDSTPGHVFVVVNPNHNEIWIDPVLSSFNSREEIPYNFIDKRPKSSLGKINRSIGVIPALAIEAASIILPSIIKLVGSDLNGTVATRKLFANYVINVQGNGGLYSDYWNSNLDTPQATQQAQAWFTAALGVPIYDYDRYSALAGLATGIIPIQLNANTHEPITELQALTNPTIWVNPGEPNGRNVNQRLADYKKIANIPGELNGVTDNDIIQAINIASNMEAIKFNDHLATTSGNKPGNWKNLPVADSNVTRDYFTANASNLTSGENQVTNAGETAAAATSNTWLWLAAGGAGLYLLSSGKKKVSGMNKNTTNMILLVAAAGTVVYFLTKKPATTPATIVVGDHTGTMSNPLDSLISSISNIFKSSGPDVPSSGSEGQPVATIINNPSPINTDPGSVYSGPISTNPNIFQAPYLDSNYDFSDLI